MVYDIYLGQLKREEFLCMILWSLISENLELIEQGKAGPPRESSEEPSTPIKTEPIPVQVTPVKSKGLVVNSQSGQVTIIKKEAAVCVKLEPEINVTDVNPYDPPMMGVGVQVLYCT